MNLASKNAPSDSPNNSPPDGLTTPPTVSVEQPLQPGQGEIVQNIEELLPIGSNIAIETIANPVVDITVEQALLQNSELIQAIYMGTFNTVTALLADHPDINFQNQWHETALIAASEEGHLDTVTTLLGYQDIAVNHPDYKGKTALMRAIIATHIEVVSVLLAKKGIAVNHQDHKGRTALMHAVKKADVDTVNALLAHPNINLKFTDAKGHTALQYAIEKQDLLIEILLRQHDEP
jgi:ankyrin repeat protein